ncbi:MAG: 3-deoxy-manno-octulosonate cytidylyltransferase [Proteobacteria bacterium]|nr:3-deoxy-manno-octulosonate cytidylyltransferase [Pseudomonadota bacterium]
MLKAQIIIPARFASTRLPEKMLLDIHGKPVIVRTCEQAAKANAGEVIVACDDERVKKAVESNGFKAIMTDPELPSGSDRIYEAMIALEKETGEKTDIIINVQGDEPLLPPELISDTMKILRENNWVDVLTYAHSIDYAGDLNNPNLVKVVTDENNQAHYFSRSLIPHDAKTAKRHIGFYAYRRDALEKFVKAEQSPLEKQEKLEQLRGLNLGLKYYVAMTDQAPVGIDTQKDLDQARELFRK